MMIHVEDAFVANGTVVCPCWLHFIASVTLATPYLPQLIDSLCTVFHKPFHVLGEAFKPVIFFAISKLIIRRYIHFYCFAMFPIFLLFSFFLYSLEVFWIARTNSHGEEVIKNYVVEEAKTDGTPCQT